MIKKYWKIALSVFFFVVIVPIIINESYKAETIYATMWEASDVLVLYGTILGSAVTVMGLSATITFSRKQIQRETFLKVEKEKWGRIEADFSDALDIINPMIPLNASFHHGKKNPSEAETSIEKYMLSSTIVKDKLNSHLSLTDTPKVKDLIDSIEKVVDEVHKICFEELDAYNRLKNIRGKDAAEEALAAERENPRSIPPDIVSFCERILISTDGWTEESILDHITELNSSIIKAYRTLYRPLIQQKVSTFETINKEIETSADRILHLWEKE